MIWLYVYCLIILVQFPWRYENQFSLKLTLSTCSSSSRHPFIGLRTINLWNYHYLLYKRMCHFFEITNFLLPLKIPLKIHIKYCLQKYFLTRNKILNIWDTVLLSLLSPFKRNILSSICHLWLSRYRTPNSG